MLVALTGGNVIDGTGGAVLPNGSVVIENGRILNVGQQRKFGSNTCVVDVGGKTIMPGIIDAHTHFGGWFQWLISQQSRPLMYLGAKTAYALRGCLEAGCTTARDMGGLEVGFCQAVDEGLIPGPRLQTSLVIIQPTNGLLDSIPGLGRAISPQGQFLTIPGVPSPWCDGPDQARAKVREVLRYGAHVIKIANDGVGTARMKRDRALFTKEELEAIVDEAHRAGVSVACHANYVPTALMAIRAGVDSIEHGTGLTDRECLDEMAKRGTWYVTSLSNIHWHATKNPDAGMREFATKEANVAHEAMRMALTAGVRIAMGTDSGYATGENALELKWLVESGMTPMQAIQTSTQRAAECMGMHGEVGTLEHGKYADLLVVDGDPLADIDIVCHTERLALVMKGGVAYSGELARSLPYKPPEWPQPLV